MAQLDRLNTFQRSGTLAKHDVAAAGQAARDKISVGEAAVNIVNQVGVEVTKQQEMIRSNQNLEADAQMQIADTDSRKKFEGRAFFSGSEVSKESGIDRYEVVDGKKVERQNIPASLVVPGETTRFLQKRIDEIAGNIKNDQDREEWVLRQQINLSRREGQLHVQATKDLETELKASNLLQAEKLLQSESFEAYDNFIEQIPVSKTERAELRSVGARQRVEVLVEQAYISEDTAALKQLKRDFQSGSYDKNVPDIDERRKHVRSLTAEINRLSEKDRSRETSAKGRARADNIVAKNDNLKEALTAAGQITNTEVHDNAVARIKAHYNAQDTIARQKSANELNEFKQVLQNHPNPSYDLLENAPNPDARRYGFAFIEELSRGRTIHTDMEHYQMLVQESVTQPELFLARNLAKDSALLLSEGDLRSLINVSNAMREEGAKAPDVKNWITVDAAAKRGLGNMGLDPANLTKKGDASDTTRFVYENMVGAIEDAFTAKGSKLTDTEITDVVNRATIDAKVEGTFWGFNDRGLNDIPEENRLFVPDAESILRGFKNPTGGDIYNTVDIIWRLKEAGQLSTDNIIREMVGMGIIQQGQAAQFLEGAQ